MRLFIAVTVPDDIKEQIVALQSDLRSARADIKWVEKDNFHVTLKFLGETAEEKLDGIVSALSSALADIKPFALSFAGVGAFPGVRAPRVVWLGINEGKEQLKEAAQRIDETLSKLGFAKEIREFSSHATLGRLRSAKNRGILAEKIQKYGEAAFGPFTVDHIDVMQSFLSPSGPRYQCLKSISI